MERKVLILGDGLLGKELAHQRPEWGVLSRKKDGIDFTNWRSYHKKLQGYDTILNCIAYTDTRDNTREKHWEVNYKAVANLIELCNEYNQRLVHISTDYIYANSPAFASEETAPANVSNWYSYTKLLSDGLVQLESEDYLLMRCSFKPYPYPYDKAWPDLIGNFDYVDRIAGLMIDLIEADASGVYNVGTGLKTLLYMADRRPATTDIKMDLTTYGERPHDITMNLTKQQIALKKLKIKRLSDYE